MLTTRYYTINDRFIRTPLTDMDVNKKLRRINNFHFANKEEIVDFLLFVYIQLLENSLQQKVAVSDNNFSLEFLKKQSRLLIFLDEKYFSIALPFDILFSGRDFYVKSKKFKENISIESLRILKILFDRVIIEDLNLSLMDYLVLIEDIYKEYCDDNGLLVTDCERICKLLLELLEYDSSYIRFDIDFEHCLDDNKNMTPERCHVHPPYHFDTDYHDSRSFKIGVDFKIDEITFKQLFEKDKDCLFIKESYKPNVSKFMRR